MHSARPASVQANKSQEKTAKEKKVKDSEIKPFSKFTSAFSINWSNLFSRVSIPDNVSSGKLISYLSKPSKRRWSKIRGCLH